jgi:hypothetical protein
MIADMKKLIISGNEQIDKLIDDISHSRSIIMNRSALVMLLQRYVNGDVSSKSIVSLANILEMNERLNRGGGEDRLINDVIFLLANPEINGEITEDNGLSLIKILKE